MRLGLLLPFVFSDVTVCLLLCLSSLSLAFCDVGVLLSSRSRSNLFSLSEPLNGEAHDQRCSATEVAGGLLCME